MYVDESDRYFDYTSVKVTEDEFNELRDLIYDVAGISLQDRKKTLVSGRLSKRLRYHRLTTYTAYIDLVKSNHKELEMMINLVSTNETYFFRENAHFDFLASDILPSIPRTEHFRVWSAASSSGEEAYTTAMVIAHANLGFSWEIFGTDISTRILETAKQGLYPITAADKIPTEYLKKYCRKGVREMTGTMLIDKELRSNTSFQYMNLNDPPWPNIGTFNVIFLRNVMIYFDKETKKQLVLNVIQRLKPGGYLFLGHSESLLGIEHNLITVRPATYRKKS